MALTVGTLDGFFKDKDFYATVGILSHKISTMNDNIKKFKNTAASVNDPNVISILEDIKNKVQVLNDQIVNMFTDIDRINFYFTCINDEHSRVNHPTKATEFKMESARIQQELEIMRKELKDTTERHSKNLERDKIFEELDKLDEELREGIPKKDNFDDDEEIFNMNYVSKRSKSKPEYMHYPDMMYLTPGCNIYKLVNGKHCYCGKLKRRLMDIGKLMFDTGKTMLYDENVFVKKSNNDGMRTVKHIRNTPVESGYKRETKKRSLDSTGITEGPEQKKRKLSID